MRKGPAIDSPVKTVTVTAPANRPELTIAPTIHAGFGDATPDGIPLQLEIWNVGPLAIDLQAEMRVCQLIFEEVHGTPDRGYQGQFQQQGPKA